MSEHNHDEGCDCGCEHDHEEELRVTLTLDNDEVISCIVLTIFEAGDNEYIALLPEKDNDDGEVFLYRYFENDGEPTLANIEDDDEYELVADAFDELLDSAEYDEIVEEAETE